MSKPRIIDFLQTGESETGFISVATIGDNIPFSIKRVYWIYGTQTNQVRGNHAHKVGDQVLINISGNTKVSLENKDGEKSTYILTNPNQGLLIPSLYWLTIHIIEPSILVCISAEEFDEKNYIRDYSEFKS